MSADVFRERILGSCEPAVDGPFPYRRWQRVGDIFFISGRYGLSSLAGYAAQLVLGDIVWKR